MCLLSLSLNPTHNTSRKARELVEYQCQCLVSVQCYHVSWPRITLRLYLIRSCDCREDELWLLLLLSRAKRGCCFVAGSESVFQDLTTINIEWTALLQVKVYFARPQAELVDLIMSCLSGRNFWISPQSTE